MCLIREFSDNLFIYLNERECESSMYLKVGTEREVGVVLIKREEGSNKTL